MTKYTLLRAREDGAICDKDGNVVAYASTAVWRHNEALDPYLTPAIVELPERKHVGRWGPETFTDYENEGYNACITDMEETRDGRA